MAKKRSKYLQGRRIDPQPITPETTLADLVDDAFLAYNAARLREACQLFTQKMLEPDVTVGNLGAAQFDYDKEVKAARAEYPALRRALGLDASVKLPGE